MKDSVRIELDGKDGDLSAEVFLYACRELLVILKNVDSSLSNQTFGALAWTLEGLKKQSPATMILSPRLKPGIHDPDMLDLIPRSCIEGLSLLEAKAARPKPFADATLKHVRNLGAYYQTKLGKCSIAFHGKTVDITSRSVAHINTLLGEVFEAEGSVVGNLESVTIHKGNEFRIWEEVSGHPVRCRFSEELFETVKAALGRRVVVEGLVKSNALAGC
ncbi:MAG: hypothetical protein KGO52_08550 [Nitrospirota bacterium]|nr:hypothetical protein [Nitrospirota bacterium]MDE3242750.1 hypothetical protein [Nitrospirota bacterium]